jgi:diguanylate cyclase (GGDEF)-like protein
MFSSPARRRFAAQERRFSAPVAARKRVEEEARAFLLVGIVVLGASLLGLASRYAFSVAFWPANAVLVGLMLRNPQLIRASAWAGAAVGFVAADLLFGTKLSLAIFFAAANLLGALTATALLLRLDERDLGLRRVHSMLRILACLLPACLASALLGALLVRVEFDGSALQALTTWPASELVNYLTVLPAMLTVTAHWRGGRPALPWARQHGGTDPWPALALAMSCIAAVAFDGPGSIMFPMPALLLCALTYPIPLNALLTMALGTGCLTTIGLGVVDIGQDMSVPEMVVSVRIAVAFLVLVPLTIGSAMAVRDDLLTQLRTVADHDGLTGLLNRRAFEQRMTRRLSAAPAVGRAFAVLWLDIDHFKSINDRHGHLAGDAVLQDFARIARSCCREGDLVGRWGGEEFALVVEVSDRSAAAALAERLRETFAAHVTVWNGVPIRATLSIGAYVLDRPHPNLPSMIHQLDEALYRAKRMGRDRIEWLPPCFEQGHGFAEYALSA